MRDFISFRLLLPVLAGCLLLSPAVDRARPAAAEGVPPEEEYKIVVQWDGKDVPGINRVTGLRRNTEVMLHRAGGDPSSPRKMPGETAYEPIVLERPWLGDSEFEKWANKTWNYGSGLGSEVSLADFRKDIAIEFYNDEGIMVARFMVYRCWPAGYEAMGDYGFGRPSAVEVLILEHEGWERDYTVSWP